MNNNDNLMQLNHLSDVVKNKLKNSKEKLREHFLSSSLERMDTTYALVSDILLSLIRKNDAKGLDAFFKKFNIEDLNFNYRDIKVELRDIQSKLSSTLTPEIFKVFVKHNFYLEEDFIYKEILNDKSDKLIMFILNSTSLNNNDDPYFLYIACSIYKDVASLHLGMNDKFKVNMDFYKSVEVKQKNFHILNIFKNHKNADKVINNSWDSWDHDDDDFKINVLLSDQKNNFFDLIDPNVHKINWDAALSAILLQTNPLSISHFNRFVENCNFLPNVNNDLNNMFVNLNKNQQKIINSIEEKLKKHSPNNYYSQEWKDDLGLGKRELIWHNYIVSSALPPANLFESFLLSSPYGQSKVISLDLIDDEKTTQAIKHALFKYPVFTQWITTVRLKDASKILSSIDGLEDWKDSNNNTIGHYLFPIVLEDIYEDEEEVEFLRPLVKKYPFWFTDKNNNNKSAIDILKNQIKSSDFMGGGIDVLNDIISYAEKQVFKKNINTVNKPFKKPKKI